MTVNLPPFRTAVFKVVVDGQDVSARWIPIVIRIVILTTYYGTSDGCQVTLDDEVRGQIALPYREGSSIPIQVALGWDSGIYRWYNGFLTAPVSIGSRARGRLLQLSASSIDPKGAWKSTRDMHMDQSTFAEFMNKLGSDAGMDVQMGSGVGDVNRSYWWAGNENFMQTAQRYANQMGLVVNVQGNQVAFTKRGDPTTVSGQQPSTVNAIVGQNVISWELSPIYNRPDFLSSSAHWYDQDAAQHKSVQGQGPQTSGGLGSGDSLSGNINHNNRFKTGSNDMASSQAGSNAAESSLQRGGGTIVLDGTPEATPGGICVVQGTRPGIDGNYIIYQVENVYERGRGYTTTLILMQPNSGSPTDTGVSIGAAGSPSPE